MHNIRERPLLINTDHHFTVFRSQKKHDKFLRVLQATFDLQFYLNI